MAEVARCIRVSPGATVRLVEFAHGYIHPSLDAAVRAEAEVPDGYDPWIEVAGVFFGPDQIRILKSTLDEAHPSENVGA